MDIEKLAIEAGAARQISCFEQGNSEAQTTGWKFTPSALQLFAELIFAHILDIKEVK